MPRILATQATVDTLFDPIVVPYAYQNEAGERVVVDLPAWRCKTCRWSSLYGVLNLPMPHDCDDIQRAGLAESTQSFGTQTA